MRCPAAAGPSRSRPAAGARPAPALAAHGPSRLTQAIMELGATLCAPAPRCDGREYCFQLPCERLRESAR